MVKLVIGLSDSRAPRKETEKDKGTVKSQENVWKKWKIPLLGNPDDLFDLGFIPHICSTNEDVATYTPAEYDGYFFLVNTTTTRIEGTGIVIFKIISAKVLTLNSVLHVPTNRKNLVSATLVVMNGFEYVLVCY